ncbi:ribonuclease HII [Maribacter sp. 2307ULW6-5]|uniref:ribonuclease HII n=1 Tax=Maribacter sp. 2307ULW6-5 TaxID=3386275 RepID=UPI0039BC9EE4
MILQKFLQTALEAGTDEAGRGCLAGPVTAAAVILPAGFAHSTLTDSKKLNPVQRNGLRTVIESSCPHFGIAHVAPGEIDDLNILNASFLAMHRALDQINCDIPHIIVDGNRFAPYGNISHTCIVKGDAKFMSIAAASVLAKTHRDALMEKLHDEYPMYNWKRNKGYPTKEHRAAIAKYGLSPYHRKSFKLLPDQYRLAL